MFKDELKKARAETGLSQRKTAEIIGIPRRTYENYEMGVSTPTKFTQKALLQAVYALNRKGVETNDKISG